MFLTEKTPSAKKSSKIKAFSHSKKYFCEYLTRADDLGRVVVPKELRRTMKISEGTPLEIFIDKDGSIIFRKYSPVGELNESAKNMAECISAASGIGTAVCDRDRIIATAGIPKKDLLDKPVSKQLDELMARLINRGKESGRKKAFISSGEDTVLAAEGGLRTANAAFPISCAGDLCGMFLLIKDEDAKPGETQEHLRLGKLASDFLSRETVE